MRGDYLTGTHRTTIRLRSSIGWHWRDVVGLAHLRCDHLGWDCLSVSLLVLVASYSGVRSAFWSPPPPGTSAPPPLGILSPAQCYTPWKQIFCLFFVLIFLRQHFTCLWIGRHLWTSCGPHFCSAIFRNSFSRCFFCNYCVPFNSSLNLLSTDKPDFFSRKKVKLTVKQNCCISFSIFTFFD